MSSKQPWNDLESYHLESLELFVTTGNIPFSFFIFYIYLKKLPYIKKTNTFDILIQLIQALFQTYAGML